MINGTRTTCIISDESNARPNLRTVLALICALAVAIPAVTASADMRLWGVDENDGELFSLDSYSTLSGFTSYGRLKYLYDGKLRDVGPHIEAVGLDSDGVAYMASNHDLRRTGIDEPVLMKFDTNTASTTGPNVVTVIGQMGVRFDSSSDNITGLSFSPGAGVLYALLRDNHDSTTDRLFTINPNTGVVITDIGTISGLGEEVESGEDMAFDDWGNLYVTDNDDDHLYRVDPATAAILEVVDNNMGRSVKFEALAWDHEAGRMVAFNDYNDKFALVTLEDGNNTFLGRISGLGDVEGMDFVASDVVVPEPTTAVLLAFGAAGVLARRRRRVRQV
ncbi:MAG: PEP-CTERM sorting domain-containing protein [Phycisphaerae bacterium]|nr:PEP-CTERM sorting domain-containing protein [Phycisphaerae bacterium]